MSDRGDEDFISNVRRDIQAALEKGFEIGGLAELAACQGTYWEIVDGSAPFWNLKYFAGAPIPANYYKTCFEVEEMPADWRDHVLEGVIETVLLKPNEMEVLAVVADED